MKRDGTSMKVILNHTGEPLPSVIQSTGKVVRCAPLPAHRTKRHIKAEICCRTTLHWFVDQPKSSYYATILVYYTFNKE
ncbi:hypothetical protein Avbf_12457 [Armadillidium vulgare]|nr:hypothetical protein Avbf_12457 [Armadillidium vulgare]